MKQHYQTLGVNESATQDEIKQAYRKLAGQHHPDRGGDTATFQKIQEAYSILSDPTKKQEYDMHDGPQFFWSGQQPPDMHDIFSHFMRMNDPFGGFQRGPAKNRTINMQVNITLEEAFHGKDLIANFNLPSGKTQTINVKVPAGVNDGTTLRLSGLGDDSIPHLPRGDVHLTVIIMPHHKFIRQNDDLIYPMEISCIDAMLGCKLDVETIDGKTLEITVNPGAQHEQILSAPGYGMPNMRDGRLKGRLLMPLKIQIPTFLTEGQKELLSRFKES